MERSSTQFNVYFRLVCGAVSIQFGFWHRPTPPPENQQFTMVFRLKLQLQKGLQGLRLQAGRFTPFHSVSLRLILSHATSRPARGMRIRNLRDLEAWQRMHWPIQAYSVQSAYRVFQFSMISACKHTPKLR